MNRKLLFLTTALITGFAYAPAHAGFEWNPPPARAAKTSPSASQVPSNMPSNMGGPLTPMPGESLMPAKVEPVTESDIMDNGTPLPPVTALVSQPGMRSINNTKPQSLTGENIDAAALPLPGQAAQSPISMAETTSAVEGFGKDIPLAVALRQVVPPAYAVTYDSGVDQGKPVSWNGGSEWTNVVSDMLERRKLHATAVGNTITISQGVGADLQLPAYVPPSQMMAENQPVGGKPVLDMGQQKHWTAQPGQGLRETLQKWSGQASVELAWQDSPDLPINSAFSYDGTFDQAVDALLSLYSGDANEPHGKLYPNLPEGPSVLVIGSN